MSKKLKKGDAIYTIQAWPRECDLLGRHWEPKEGPIALLNVTENESEQLFIKTGFGKVYKRDENIKWWRNAKKAHQAAREKLAKDIEKIEDKLSHLMNIDEQLMNWKETNEKPHWWPEEYRK